MDFLEEAVAIHIGWKSRMRDFVDGRGEPLDADHIGQDQNCELGQWIHGQGQHYSHVPAYQDLRSAHQRFHACCGGIVRLAQAGDRVAARAALAGDGEYFDASSQTVVAIGDLRSAIEREQTD